MIRSVLWLLMLVATGLNRSGPALAGASPDRATNQPGLDFIQVNRAERRFVEARSGKEFHPWGFNYDHDASNRLLETYWNGEWDAVRGDFQEMKQLGANTVRIHLQVSRFMNSARETNGESLQRLAALLSLAEATGLYLDITALGCYDRQEVPDWFNQLTESARWAVQARFWGAVADTCRNSPAVFCYDLMNEPIVTEDKEHRDWTPGAFGDRYFVQRLTLDFAGRSPTRIAADWVNQMAAAIHKHDQRHLLTIGAIPWALTWPTAKPLFYSKEVSRQLDFVSLHFYPRKGEVDRAVQALAVYDIGMPIVIEEIFPLNCSMAELDQFIERSKPLAVGWLGFYWGKTIPEYRRKSGTIADRLTLEWLEYFVRKTPEILRPLGPIRGTTKRRPAPLPPK